MFLIDAHTHSRYSHDGQDAVAALCEAASRAGLSALCVTDHYDIFGRFDPVEFFAETEQARADFAGRLELLRGVELGEGHLTPDRSAGLLASAPFDFVLGSCHYMEGHPDFYEIRYRSLDQCQRLIESYLDELLRMIEWGRFDVLGHFTYPLRYMAGRDGIEADFGFCGDRVRAVFRALVRRGLGLEVNVSGLRRGFRFFMPDLPLLKLYRDCGGEIVTVGSDAHRAADVGAHISDGTELLRAAGFTRAAVYRGRKIFFMEI